MRTTARVALANLRAWGPEAAALILCFIIWAYAGGLGDAIAVAFVLAVGWWMGHRHHSLKLHEKVDSIGDGVTAVLKEVRGEGAPVANPAWADKATVHRGGRR